MVMDATLAQSSVTNLPDLSREYPLMPQQIAQFRADGFIIVHGGLFHDRGSRSLLRPVIRKASQEMNTEMP